MMRSNLSFNALRVAYDSLQALLSCSPTQPLSPQLRLLQCHSVMTNLLFEN
uniref:Uncharacterized protein n=1 Tax=Manihot esculenta TaxID=3983 RepID=A0A2C9URP1_MANES